MALSSLVAGKANANYFDGNELLAWCENWQREPDPGDDLLLGGYCGGFVGMVVDVLVNKPNTFCVPQGRGGVRSAQLVEVVKLYLHDHPRETIKIGREPPCHAGPQGKVPLSGVATGKSDPP